MGQTRRGARAVPARLGIGASVGVRSGTGIPSRGARTRPKENPLGPRGGRRGPLAGTGAELGAPRAQTGRVGNAAAGCTGRSPGIPERETPSFPELHRGRNRRGWS